MRIGLMSDSHGKTAPLLAALDLFIHHKVNAIVHCGDLGSTASLHLLANAGCPVWLVAGNMDRHHLPQLEKLTQGTSITYCSTTVEVPLEEDAMLVATHGDNDDILEALICGHQFPYVCHGHTHRVRDERMGNVRVICPGALSGPRHTAVPTVAILDTASDSLEFYDIAHPDRPISIDTPF